MATRDVDLVIRAKNQAQGALKSINTALENFVGQQGDIKRASTGTNASLDRLGKSLGGLQRALGGLSVGTTTAKELDRAKRAMDGLKKASEEATGEAIGYAREARKAARATAELREESDKVATAVTRQRAAVSQAKDAQQRLNDITRNATKDRERLAAADQKISNQLEEQRLKLFLATRAFEALQGEISQTAQPTQKLEQSLSSVSRAVRTTQERLDELRTTQAAVRSSIDQTARSVERANDAYGSSARSVDRQVAALERLEASQNELNGAVREAEAYQKSLDSAARKAEGSLKRQDAALEQSEAQYREMLGAVEQTEQALKGLEAQVRGQLLRAFGEQAAQVRRLQQEYRETSAEAQRLGKAIAGSANAPDAQVAAFGRAADAAARAKAEFREQQAALGELRRVLRESGGDVEQFAQRQERFKAALDRADRSLENYEKEVRDAANANDRLEGSSRRAASGVDRLNSSLSRTAGVARQGARETRSFAGAMREFYGEGRTALSFTQRLRGEVLALVAAYGGFFAAVQGIRNVVEAYQSLEAAQSRLRVVFDGDQQATANELDFIRRSAERLGIEFGTLSQEYSKFAVATKGTNLAGENTRRIFTSLAEAARVNKSTLPELRGVFVAVTQIVNKGTVSMEELRQQLGDRLPGAIQIMADAAGVGVAELTKMIERGQLSSDVLVRFAEELDERFGSQLPEALKSTTTALGRFQNAAFQALLRIANGGFIERFTALVEDLTDTLQSDQFISFLDRLSVAMGLGADAVAALARNFDVLVIAITAFVGFKLAPFLVFLAARMGVLTGSTVSATRGFRALSVAVNTGSVSMTRAAVAARAATIAIRSLLSATGIGLAITVIGAGIGAWATRTDEATAALNNHQRLLDDVRNAYDKVGDSVERWREELERTTEVAALKNLEQLTRQTEAAFQELRNAIPRNIFGNALDIGGGYVRQLDQLVSEFEAGGVSVEEFRDRLDELGTQFRDLFPGNAALSGTIDELAANFQDASDQQRVAQDILIALTGSTEEAEAAIARLSGTVAEAGATFDNEAQNLERWRTSIQELKDLVPSLTSEIEDLDKRADLDNALQAALRYARTWGQVLEAFRLYKTALTDFDNQAFVQEFGSVGGGAVGTAASIIRQFEGFRETPYFDVNAFRVGYGSDTVTLSDGTIQRVTEGMKVTRADADRDLVRRITREFLPAARRAIGADVFDSLTPQQQGVLTSIGYNYGAGEFRPGGDLEGVVEAVRRGSADGVAQAIRALGAGGRSGETGQALVDRRNREAALFLSGGNADLSGFVSAQEERDEAIRKAAEEKARQAEREAEARERANESTEQAIADSEQAIRQQNLILAGKEREAAVEEAVYRARRQNQDVSEDQLEIIRAQARREFDLAKQIEARMTPLERAEAAEQRINDILGLRKSLQERLLLAVNQGAPEGVISGLSDQLSGVNRELNDAIEAAIKLYKALGQSDPAIAATVSRLIQLQQSSRSVAAQITFDWQKVESTFADGLATAIDRFAESLARSRSVSQAARDAFLQFAADFLRQIARMISQQIALNVARSVFSGFGIPAGVSHSGGLVGARGAARHVDIGVFASAMRYHSGGIAGLRPNEVPTILERGEEVLTRGDPRHRFNSTAGSQPEMNVRVINALNSVELVQEALSTPPGERAVLNVIRGNPRAVRGALEGG